MATYALLASSSSICTNTISDSHEEPAFTSSRALPPEIERARRRRRHSSYNPTNFGIDTENVLVLLDRFLIDMGRRLEMMETYGSARIDQSYQSLCAIHNSCTQVGDDLVDAGRRKAKILVDMLESHYRDATQDALRRRETLEQKVQEGVKICEGIMRDFETRAYELRANGLAMTAHSIMDSGRAYMDNASHLAAEIVSEGADKARRAKEMLKIKVEDALALARKGELLTYNQLPDPWQVNPFILRGYRFCETKVDCLRSCFSLSNEMFNFWSHCFGLFMVLGMAFYAYPYTPAFTSSRTIIDVVVAGFFFFGAMKCLTCSCIWHAMSCISHQTTMETFACVDFTGIAVLVSASIITTEYTAFYCEPFSRNLWLGATFVLGVAGTILPWNPVFNRADMSWLRVGFFVGLASTGLLPILQLSYQRGIEETLFFYWPLWRSLVVYLAGAVLYAAKMPEALIPGWVDYCGSSHNIWHLAVLGGIVLHYQSMLSFFDVAFQRAETQCPAF